MKRSSLSTLSLLVLAACASPDAPRPQNVASAAPSPVEPQHCARERRVGSDIPVTTCAPALTESERRDQVEQVSQQISQQNRLVKAVGP